MSPLSKRPHDHGELPKTAEPFNIYEAFGLPPPPALSHELRIHVAESHNELRLIFVHYLAKVGFAKVRNTRNGLEALEDMKTHPTDIAGLPQT